jgi:hypothetical protein
MPRKKSEEEMSVLDQARERSKLFLGRRLTVRTSWQGSPAITHGTFDGTFAGIELFGGTYYYVFQLADRERLVKCNEVLEIDIVNKR